MSDYPIEGKYYQHKTKNPGFYLVVEEVDKENETVTVDKTGLKGLGEGTTKLPLENFNKFYEPAIF